MKDQLRSILEKYPFIHIDKLGRLSMIVPLTGAITVSTNFIVNANNPVLLYLFGDNSCQSNIEQRNFFENERFFNSFKDLISELTTLKKRQTVNKGKKFIESIISLLYQHKKEVDKFIPSPDWSRPFVNPGDAQMTNDLKKSKQGFVAKGEFIVGGREDNYRSLDLPNILSLTNNFGHNDLKKKMLNRDIRDVILTDLGTIPKYNNVLKTEQILNIMRGIGMNQCRQNLANSPAKCFEDIYLGLKKTYYPSLGAQSSSFYNTLSQQLVECTLNDKDYFSDCNDGEVADVIRATLNNAKIIDSLSSTFDTFSAIFHHSVEEFSRENQRDKSRMSTYQLFIIQTFLYLLTLQLRFKKIEDATKFLSDLQNNNMAIQLISRLCKNEPRFVLMLKEKYNISSAEYKELLQSTHEIAIAHLEAPHFDELRVACMSSSLNNMHYLVINNKLCWSTDLITEEGNVDNATQQKANFDVFYYISTQLPEIRDNLYEFLRAGAEYEAVALDSLKCNIQYFTRAENEKILKCAIENRKYQCAEFLAAHGVHNKESFLLACDQKPKKTSLIGLFIVVENSYVQNFNKVSLTEFTEKQQDDLIQTILQYNPGLLKSSPSLIGRITKEDVIRATDARDLTLVDLFLECRPNLKGQLTQDHVFYIEQQRIQKTLESQYERLLSKLDSESTLFKPRKEHVSQEMSYLYDQLKRAGDAFFTAPISPDSVKQFEQQCTAALNAAKPVLSANEGWYGYPLFIRAILGILAALTVIPAIIVQATTYEGYIGTFFKHHENNPFHRFVSDFGELSDKLTDALTVR